MAILCAFCYLLPPALYKAELDVCLNWSALVVGCLDENLCLVSLKVNILFSISISDRITTNPDETRGAIHRAPGLIRNVSLQPVGIIPAIGRRWLWDGKIYVESSLGLQLPFPFLDHAVAAIALFSRLLVSRRIRPEFVFRVVIGSFTPPTVICGAVYLVLYIAAGNGRAKEITGRHCELCRVSGIDEFLSGGNRNLVFRLLVFFNLKRPARRCVTRLHVNLIRPKRGLLRQCQIATKRA